MDPLFGMVWLFATKGGFACLGPRILPVAFDIISDDRLFTTLETARVGTTALSSVAGATCKTLIC